MDGFERDLGDGWTIVAGYDVFGVDPCVDLNLDRVVRAMILNGEVRVRSDVEVPKDKMLALCGAYEDWLNMAPKREPAPAATPTNQHPEIWVRGADLEDRLSALLNSVSAENGSDTPDFILAQYLLACLDTFNKTVRARDDWHGFKTRFSQKRGYGV